MSNSLEIKLAQQEKVVRVIYVGSYIPRECGIATFTKDLTTAINVLNPLCLAEIMAMDENGGSREYPWEVKYRIKQEDWESYEKAIEYINQSSAEIIHIQHEFGIFGGENGELVLPFMEKIEKPIVTTFHTVLEKPGDERKKIVQEIARLSKAIVVMIGAAADRLHDIYGIDKEKIVVIPHGVPDIPYGPTMHFKEELGFENNIIMSTFGLINPGKGIEFVLEALPEVVEKYPNLKFLVIGATHPNLLKQQGEVYREKLISIVNDKNLQNNVEFVNRYLSLDELIQYLRATDLYISPYLEPQQITSGTLAYALGCGKPCISTEYLYAKEVLSHGRGTIVPMKNSRAITDSITDLLDHPESMHEMEKKAYSYGRTMIWSNVALKHLNLFRLIAKEVRVGMVNDNN